MCILIIIFNHEGFPTISVKKTIRDKIFQTSRISVRPDGSPHDLSSPLLYGLPEQTQVIQIPSGGGHVMSWWMVPQDYGVSCHIFFQANKL